MTLRLPTSSYMKALAKKSGWKPAITLLGALLLWNGVQAYYVASKSDSDVKLFSMFLFSTQIILGALLLWKHSTPKVISTSVQKLFNYCCNEKTLFYGGAAAIILNGGFAVESAVKSESDTKVMAIVMASLQIVGGLLLAGYGMYYA